MTARATATSCCWPPESCVGIQVLLADDLEPVEHVADQALALGLLHVAVGERHVEVLVDRQVVEQVVALEDEADVLLLQLGALLLAERCTGWPCR